MSNQCFTLCQEEKWSLPEYKILDITGTPHNPRFSAQVKVEGNRYVSPGMYKSSKEAQSQAARMAINFRTTPDHRFHAISMRDPTSVVGDEADDISNLYKNRLLIFAQMHKLGYPTYEVEIFGPLHNPSSRAEVSIDGKRFNNPRSFPNKKSAEHAAAKVALMSLPANRSDVGEAQGKVVCGAEDLISGDTPRSRRVARREQNKSIPKQEEEKREQPPAVGFSAGAKRGPNGFRGLVLKT